MVLFLFVGLVPRRPHSPPPIRINLHPILPLGSPTALNNAPRGFKTAKKEEICERKMNPKYSLIAVVMVLFEIDLFRNGVEFGVLGV